MTIDTPSLNPASAIRSDEGERFSRLAPPGESATARCDRCTWSTSYDLARMFHQ
jgi:hypothetical protein